MNRNGNTLLFVMALVVVTGFIGVSLIKLSNSDATSQVMYSSSESARAAAKAGISASIARLSASDPDSISKILEILNTYVNTPIPDTLSDDKYTWLTGSSTIWDNLSSSQKYKTKIVGFNPNTFEISLLSYGVGQGNSKATMLGVYRLLGLKRDIVLSTDNAPTNAIQLDNGNYEFNCHLIVNGNTLVRDKLVLNSDRSDFRGYLCVDTLLNGTLHTTTLNQDITVDSGAYFAGGLTYYSRLEFRQNVAFKGALKGKPSNLVFITHTENGSSVSDSIYVCTSYGSAGFSGRINLNDKTVFLYGNNSNYNANENGTHYTGTGIFKNKMEGSPLPDVDSIRELISPAFGKHTQKIDFNTSLIDTIYKVENSPRWSNRITADTLNAWYLDAQSKNKLWNGFMVIKFTATSSEYNPFDSSSTYFSKKVIIIDENPKVRFEHFFNTHMNQGTTVLFVENYPSNTDIFTNGVKDFRGFIYVNRSSGKYFCMGGTSPDTLRFKGAVYVSPNANSKFDGGAGKVRIVTWDPTVINELNSLGMFSDSTNTNTTTNTDIILDPSYNKIKPRLLGSSM